MVNLDALSDEELVQQARHAFEANTAGDFQAAAGALLKRYEKMIAGLVYRRLSRFEAQHLFEDVVQDVCRDILAQLQSPQLKPSLRVVFKLTVNTTCREVVEIALRCEGYTVPSRHATPRVAKQPNVIPQVQRISLDQPVDDEYDDRGLRSNGTENTLKRDRVKGCVALLVRASPAAALRAFGVAAMPHAESAPATQNYRDQESSNVHVPAATGEPHPHHRDVGSLHTVESLLDPYR